MLQPWTCWNILNPHCSMAIDIAIPPFLDMWCFFLHLPSFKFHLYLQNLNSWFTNVYNNKKSPSRAFRNPTFLWFLWSKSQSSLSLDPEHIISSIWGWVKTLVLSEPQNSWDLWMFIPLKMVFIGIDPYPYPTAPRPGRPSPVLPVQPSWSPARWHLATSRWRSTPRARRVCGWCGHGWDMGQARDQTEDDRRSF